jgi:hypothetical protein
MKGIKVLQAATLGTFILFVIIGIFVLFAFPEKMTAYRDFIGAIWPIFVAEVVPAFLGTPLKEYVKNKGSKNDNA